MSSYSDLFVDAHDLWTKIKLNFLSPYALLLLPLLLVVLTCPREKNKNDGHQAMNPPHQQVHLPLVINVLLLTMIVEMKLMMRRNMMIARMNLHHHKVHFPIFLPLIMMTGKKRPMMCVRKKFTSSTPISTKKTRCS
jgi:hypothetical protein